MQLTPWYPPDTKPVRTGWYECKCCNLRYFWSGIGWKSLKQDIEWRGARMPNDASQPHKEK
jgi:hypothetical protein